MSNRKIRYFIMASATLLFVVLIGATTAIAKAEAEGLGPAEGSSTPILKAATTIGTQEGTPENIIVEVEDLAEIPESIVSLTDNEEGGVSTETATPIATDIPENIATSKVTDLSVVTELATVTETQTNTLTPTATETDTTTPTPTEVKDTTSPVIQFSTVNASAGSITIRISITDDFGIERGSYYGQASEVNGSTQACNLSDDGNQLTCTLVLSNGNYHIQISAADKAGNATRVDLPDFTVQISDAN